MSQGLGTPPPSRPKIVDDVDTTEDRAWRCGRCNTRISHPDAIIAIGGQSTIGRYLNPSGVLWDIVTVAHAHNVVCEGRITRTHSWFPGYSWRILACAGCYRHLGWRYDAPDREPPTFWGLIRTRLKIG